MKPNSSSLKKTAIALLLTLTLAASTGRAGSVPAPYELGTWQGFRPSAVSYTFDDSCANQFVLAIPMFNQKGLKLTLFSCTSVMFAGWPNLQNAAANGHEVASHTVSHANLAAVSESQQLIELTNSQNAINANVTTQKCVTLAYPYCTGGNESLAAQYYIAARNCSGQINSSTPANFMQISCYICGSAGSIQTLQQFTNAANGAVAVNGWCVYLIHGIDNDGGYSPTASTNLQASVDFFSTNSSRYWVQTFGNVTRYIKERTDVTVVETGSGADSITLQVTDTLDNTIYNYPITLRRPLPTGWSWAAALQNNAPITSQIVTNGSQIYVMFDVVPDAGEVTLYRTEPAAQLQVVIPATATEGDGLLPGQGSVSVIPIPTNDVVVNLTSSDTSEVTVPSSVTYPAGQTNVVFDLTVMEDTALDGDQIATVSASASGYGIAQDAITVHDNDTAVLTVTLPATASEGDGTLVNAGIVSVATPVEADFLVHLASSDISELAVPATTVIHAGQTSGTFNLRIVDDEAIDGPQTAGVTAHVSNWTDGFGTMTVLDNDGFPHHYAWSVVPSPQLIGEPFHVTVTAQDANNIPLDFRLSVAFSALAPTAAPATNTLLGSPTHEDSGYDGDTYTLGHSFTPGTNLWVTGVRYYFGDKVSIWSDSGVLLASQDVVSVPGTWLETPLAVPILLVAGATYRIGVHESSVDYFWSYDLPETFPDGTIDDSWWDYGDAFPTQADAVRWYFVDLRYATGVESVPVSPVVSGNFTNGIWSGDLAVLQPAANVVLVAGNGPGHLGQSGPFDVVDTPQLTIAAAGGSVVISWPAAATGFTVEQTHVLASPDWTSAPGVPAVVGDRYVVTNTPATTNTYYRLRKP
jgi:oligosaccharide reducing-end xylanase